MMGIKRKNMTVVKKLIRSNYTVAVLLVSLVCFSCSKDEIEAPMLSVTYTPSNPVVGETVTFTILSDAQYLAAYPGDSTHEWRRSLEYAEFDGGDADDDDEFLQEMTPFTNNYFVDFRVLGVRDEPIPAEIQGNEVDLAMDYDPIYNLWALRLSNPSENRDSTSLAIVNPGSYLWGENKDLEMDIRAIDTVSMNLIFYLEIGGIMVDESLTWTREVGNDSENFLLYEGQTDENLENGVDFNLTPLVERWVEQNPELAVDSMEVTKLIVVFKATEDSPSAWSDLYISFMELGYPDLRPFDTGFNVEVTNLDGEQTFDYVYNGAGAFAAMFIATNVDYISRSADYTDGREPDGNEYDYLRSYFELVINVSD